MSNEYVATEELQVGDILNRDGGGYTMTLLKLVDVEEQPFSSYTWYTFLVINNIDLKDQRVYRHRFHNLEQHRVIGNIGDEVITILEEN